MRGEKGLVQDVVKDEEVNRSRQRQVGDNDAIYCEISFKAPTTRAQWCDMLCWKLTRTYLIDIMWIDKCSLV